MIDFTYTKNQDIISKNIIKTENKFLKEFDLKNKTNKEKLVKLYLIELLKLNNFNNINNNYISLSSLNVTKILTYILLVICKKNKQKIHIILSYYESNYIINICKQLVKNNLIELSIIKGINIIDEIKILKKNNTKIIIASNINNNINYNVKKIHTYCKYYNILFISNIENNILNYSECNKYFINQDILLINYTNYIINSKKYNIYYIFIKKDLLLNYELDDFITKNQFNINNFNLYLLLNLIDINKFNNIQVYNNNLSKIKELYNHTFNELKTKFNIIQYNDLIKIKNKLSLHNTITLVLFNNRDDILYNYINFSILIPNLSFNKKIINNYFKSKSIILENSYKFFINNNDLYYDELKKGEISLFLHLNTKINDINKFLLNFYELVNILMHNTKKNKIRKKKHVSFTTPEFIICKKKHSPTKLKKKIKSILK